MTVKELINILEYWDNNIEIEIVIPSEGMRYEITGIHSVEGLILLAGD